MRYSLLRFTYPGIQARWCVSRAYEYQGQQARASENFAGPVDFEFIRAYESFKNVLANLAVVFQNLQAQQHFHRPWPVGRGLS